MSASLVMESTFRGPLAPGYYNIINLTVNNPQFSFPPDVQLPR